MNPVRTFIIILLVLFLTGIGFFIFGPRNEFWLKFNGGGVACTAEAKLCPDGSAVGRVGPNCEFAECPSGTGLLDTETPAGSFCGTDAECRCRNFNGAEFLPGTYPGRCDLEKGVCLACVYR
jgi:hypothetical protein